MIDVREAIARAHQEEWARVVALTRRFGDLDIAEEAAAEAFATAVERWPVRRRTSQPRRLADHHRQAQGHRPHPAREQARGQAEGGSDVVRRRPARACRRHRRRAAAADLHLLSPCARDADSRDADAAHGRRSDRGRDRPVPSWCRRPQWGSGSFSPTVSPAKNRSSTRWLHRGSTASSRDNASSSASTSTSGGSRGLSWWFGSNFGSHGATRRNRGLRCGHLESSRCCCCPRLLTRRRRRLARIACPWGP